MGVLEISIGAAILLIVLFSLSGVLGFVKDGTLRMRIIIVLVVVAAGLGITLFNQSRKQKKEAMKNFVAANFHEFKVDSMLSDLSAEPYLAGKLILVNLDAKSLDPIMGQVPSALRADDPSEVGTVVLLNWSKEEIGHYEGYGGSPAMRWHCNIALIDWKAGRLLAVKEFLGSMPPAFLDRREGTTGSKPDDKVLDFLTSLPRR